MRNVSNKPLLFTLSDSFLGSYGSAGNRSQDEWHLFDWRDCATCPNLDDCDPGCLHLSTIPFEKIGGFVFEPGSSSGLVRFPPKSLIQNISKLIKQHSGFIQINEITTGMGRTGKWFGFQHYDMHPDIVSIGKGLGNGFPVSAIAMSREIIAILDQISFHYHQSHQNDPLGSAVAKQVITVLKEQNLIEKCNQIGAYFLERLFQLKNSYQFIKEIRGRGLMIAIEFQETTSNEFMDTLYQKCIRRGYIIARRPGLNVFRIDPPLIISKKQIDDFLENFEQILNESS
ncbi:MAG: aminotransferase class III-fold pyridoxal phosphate-dependent enzyme [Candidatus Zhuqueibacterota bacterium]